MKKLSDFKDESAVIVVADLLDPIMTIVTNPENEKFKDSNNGIKMFAGFFKNSPRAMMDVFAILSEEDPKTYTCDGVDVAKSLMVVASDSRLVELFTSQGQTGDATSSGSASENIEE